MEGKITKSSLLNVYTAADTVVAAGTLTITGLMKIKTAKIVSMTKQVAVTEVRQVVTIGSTSLPVITACTKYQVKIGNTGNRREGAQSQLLSFGYTSPFVLSGSAATDRYNMESALAKKINSTASVFAKAFAAISVAYVVSAGAAVVGDIVTETATGATGVVTSLNAGVVLLTIGVTSGTFLGTGAGTIVTTNPTTGAVTMTSTSATHAVVLGLGLRIVDDAGYYGPYTGSFRRGPNTVLVTAGFATTDLVITTAGVVGIGQGTRMLENVPVRELTSGNLAKGFWSFPTNNPPIAGDHYTTYVIVSNGNAFQDALSDNAETHETTQVLYLDENIPNTGAGVNAGYVAVTAILDAFLV